MPLTQKLAVGLTSLAANIRGRMTGTDTGTGTSAAPMSALFPKTDPAVDGDECLRDCDSCTARYPRGFKVETGDALYGQVKGWSVHLLVATGMSDWKRDIEDERGSVMETLHAVGVKGPDGGRVMVSASDMAVPHCHIEGGCEGEGEGQDGDTAGDYSRPTTVLVLPAFTIVDNVTPAGVPSLVKDIISTGPTTGSPLRPVSMLSSGGCICRSRRHRSCRRLTRRCPPNRVGSRSGF